jgi:hypothetical protein
MFYNHYYNIAFVNSERWLAKRCVHITQCQHGNIGKFLSLYFFVLYYKTNIKHFFRIDIQLYQHSWKLGKLEILWKHSVLRASCFRTIWIFSFSQFPLVLICILYINTGNVLYLLNIKASSNKKIYITLTSHINTNIQKTTTNAKISTLGVRVSAQRNCMVAMKKIHSQLLSKHLYFMIWQRMFRLLSSFSSHEAQLSSHEVKR